MFEIAPMSTRLMTYEESVLYCQFLDHNGHKDWRLPTRTEYMNSGVLTGWYVDRAKYEDLRVVYPVRGSVIELAGWSSSTMSYDEALLYCQQCTYGGHSDWRLPTFNEYKNHTNLIGWYLHQKLDDKPRIVQPVRNV